MCNPVTGLYKRKKKEEFGDEMIDICRVYVTQYRDSFNHVVLFYTCLVELSVDE